MDYTIKSAELLTRVRADKPLLHHITNFVAMNDNANMALHIGASPVMAHAHEEAAQMASFASALTINIGTLDSFWIKSMELAMSCAASCGIPIILDPVGAGATQIRTDTTLRFLKDFPVSVLKGNLGEISFLAGLGGKVKGVDSLTGGDAIEAARTAARKYGCVAAVTAKSDAVSDGKRTLIVRNESDWLGTITGSGCSAATVVSAFCAVEKDFVTASACALAVYALAAEIASEDPVVRGPQSFKAAFFDAVYNLSDSQVKSGVRIEEA